MPAVCSGPRPVAFCGATQHRARSNLCLLRRGSGSAGRACCRECEARYTGSAQTASCTANLAASVLEGQDKLSDPALCPCCQHVASKRAFKREAGDESSVCIESREGEAELDAEERSLLPDAPA